MKVKIIMPYNWVNDPNVNEQAALQEVFSALHNPVNDAECAARMVYINNIIFARKAAELTAPLADAIRELRFTTPAQAAQTPEPTQHNQTGSSPPVAGTPPTGSTQLDQ